RSRVTRASHWMVLSITLLAGACGGQPQPALEITTRAGSAFVLAHPVVNYERGCSPGAYPLYGDPEKRGPRVRGDRNGNKGGSERPPSSEAASAKSEAVQWTALAEIEFGELVGDAGEYCDGPDSVSAKISYRDGHQEQRMLIDTTDRGIEGVSERGPITIPIR